MNTGMLHGWQPRNINGSMAYDPREELEVWARNANGQPMVAVPVATLLAAADVRVCRDSWVCAGDEDGPLPPQTLHCNKMEGHLYDHSNGAVAWRAA